MDDKRRSINTIFWLMLLFALSVLMIPLGAAWAFLEWAGTLESEVLWAPLLVCGLGMLGALGSFAGIITWLVRKAPTLY